MVRTRPTYRHVHAQLTCMCMRTHVLSTASKRLQHLPRHGGALHRIYLNILCPSHGKDRSSCLTVWTGCQPLLKPSLVCAYPACTAQVCMDMHMHASVSMQAAFSPIDIRPMNTRITGSYLGLHHIKAFNTHVTVLVFSATAVTAIFCTGSTPTKAKAVVSSHTVRWLMRHMVSEFFNLVDLLASPHH